MIQQLFGVARRRAGFDEDEDIEDVIPDTFRRPGGAQTTLFDDKEEG
jgi:hypothetical protein